MAHLILNWRALLKLKGMPCVLSLNRGTTLMQGLTPHRPAWPRSFTPTD